MRGAAESIAWSTTGKEVVTIWDLEDLLLGPTLRES